MADPIRFYLDFASPYSYFAVDAIEKLAAEHGRAVEWRPVIMWAVMKAHGIAPPMDVPAKREYFLADMIRSAAFLGVPYREPGRMPVTSHLATRAYLAFAQYDVDTARAFADAVFAAFFTRGIDISDKQALLAVASEARIAEGATLEAMEGALGRHLLAQAVDQAIGDKVTGVPFFIVDGETFFGVDRLPQIKWRLSTEARRVMAAGRRMIS